MSSEYDIRLLPCRTKIKSDLQGDFAVGNNKAPMLGTGWYPQCGSPASFGSGTDMVDFALDLP